MKWKGTVFVIALAAALVLPLAGAYAGRHEVESPLIDTDGVLGWEPNFWPNVVGSGLIDEAALTAAFSGGNGKWSSGAGLATINIAFNGTGVAVLYGVHVQGATFSYDLDNGAASGVVVTLGSPASQQTLVVAATGTLSPGAHVLRILNGGGAYVVIDAIDVYDEVPLNYAEAEDPTLVQEIPVQGPGAGYDNGFGLAHGPTIPGLCAYVIGGATPDRSSWTTTFTGTDVGILYYNGWLYGDLAGLDYDIDSGAITGSVNQGPSAGQLGVRRPTLLATGLANAQHTITVTTTSNPNVISTFDGFFSSGTFALDVEEWDQY